MKKLKRLADIEVLPAWQESHVDRSSICGVRVSAHFKLIDSDSHLAKFKVNFEFPGFPSTLGGWDYSGRRHFDSPNRKS